MIHEENLKRKFRDTVPLIFHYTVCVPLFPSLKRLLCTYFCKKIHETKTLGREKIYF
jgi:hypothetical protein